MFHIYDIKINELENPLGLDIKSPRFSWKLRSENRIPCRKKRRFLSGQHRGHPMSGTVELWKTIVPLGLHIQEKN